MSDAELRYLHVAGLVFGQPLLATIEAAETVGAYLRARMEGLEVGANRFVGEQQVDPQNGRWKGYRKVNGVAAVSILGELVNRGAWMGANSGLTSYEGLVEQVRQAGLDPEVSSILLDINSPGGEAWGMVDAARQLRAAANGKRLVSLANPIAASAAYGLAAVADKVYVNEAGLMGSIGCVMVHIDQSQRLKNNGVKATIIATGAKKLVGHPAVPLDEDGLALLQARAARVMDGFTQLVTQHRPQLTAAAIDVLQGDVLIGLDAVTAGLADELGTFESVLADLSRAPGRSTRSTKGKSMTEPTSAPAAETPAGITQAQLDAAVATATTAARADFQAQISADRTRMAALDELAAECNGNAEGLAIVAAAKADGSTAEATALKLVKAGVFKKAAMLGALQQDEASAAGAAPAAPGAGGKSKANTREELIAEYNASDKLKSEYITAESYAAAVLHDRKKGIAA